LRTTVTTEAQCQQSTLYISIFENVSSFLMDVTVILKEDYTASE